MQAAKAPPRTRRDEAAPQPAPLYKYHGTSRCTRTHGGECRRPSESFPLPRQRRAPSVSARLNLRFERIVVNLKLCPHAPCTLRWVPRGGGHGDFCMSTDLLPKVTPRQQDCLAETQTRPSRLAAMGTPFPSGYPLTTTSHLPATPPPKGASVHESTPALRPRQSALALTCETRQRAWVKGGADRRVLPTRQAT